ncbi:MAG TPA: cytosine permease, partial [Gemmataceae bacterium]|nr:cytosine permease [Gemmataceae bacterium]
DYFVIRKTRLDQAGLYLKSGPYWYLGGVNLAAMLALALGIAPCVPGFLATIKVADFGPFWTELYKYAWFVSFGVAFVVYFIAMRMRR